MDINSSVTSENSLLADRSYMSGQSESSHVNGYSLEWTNKMNGTSSSHVWHGECKFFYLFPKYSCSFIKFTSPKLYAFDIFS